MMDKHIDTLVIGGGIIGHSVSYYLSESGHSSLVVEKNTSGNRATKAAAGMLGVHTENKEAGAFHQFCENSRNLYKKLSTDLYAQTGIDISFSQFGMLEIAIDPRHHDDLLAKRDLFPDLMYLSGHQLRERIPAVTKKASGALFMKEDGHVEPTQACEAFKRGALAHGGDLLENNEVVRIEKSKGSFKVHLENGSLTAEKIVVASGAESGRWFTGTSLSNPMVPTKGECFSIKPNRHFVNETLFFRNFYLVPKLDGRLVIGATTIPEDRSTTTTAGGLSKLMNDVFSIFPDLQEEAFHGCWSGIRPGSVDGRPIIGEHPEMEGLYFATGHYRNGILLAPATGQIIKDMISGKTVPNVLKEMFSPERFQREGGSRYEYSR
ncbi:glycine oxidase ThiO [Halobacillus sp. H74]